MERLLLAEDVFLLGHDDESGKNTASLGLQGALAGALLIDLAEQELITVDDDGVVATTGASPDHPLLTRAVEAVQVQAKPKKLGHWLDALPRALKPFDRAVGESLVARGILDEKRGKVLGLFDSVRWPERDPAPEQQLRAELREALLGVGEPSARSVLLVGLVQHYGMVDRLVDKPERKQARARATELAKLAESGDVVSHAVGDAARRATQAALTATMVATTAAATVNVSSG